MHDLIVHTVSVFLGFFAMLVITITAFAALCVVTYVCFIFGRNMVHFLGQNGLSVVTRMMGLILAVIGVQMLVEGINGAIVLTG